MADATVGALLTLDVERFESVAVVRCHGRLTSGVTDILYTRVSQLFPDSKRIVLDLTDLNHMDSMGLGTLVRLYVSSKPAGCSLELINLGKRIKELLGMTNLLSVFTIVGEHNIKMM